MIRLAVRCRPEQAEVVLAELVELVPGGVEEERGADYVEYAIYGPPGELPELPDLQAAAGDGLVEIETTEIPDDWADRWRDFHEPVVVGGGRLVVRPSWEADGRRRGGGRHRRRSRPGVRHRRPRDDAVLPRAAARSRRSRRGARARSPTGAPDRACSRSPPRSSAGTRSSAAITSRPRSRRPPPTPASNGVAVAVERVNLREESPPEAPTVVANLTAPLLLPLAARIAAGEIATPARMVLSGLLRTRAGPGRGRLRRRRPRGRALRSRTATGRRSRCSRERPTSRRPAR